MSQFINLGEKVPVVFQSSVAETGLFVRATIKDNDENTLAVLALTHVVNGLYLNDNYLMPAKAFITVQYDVFKDAGFTLLDDSYLKAIDVFSLLFVETSGAGESLADIVALVSNSSENIIAKIGGSKIVARISETISHESEKVIAYISSNPKPIMAKIGSSNVRAYVTDCVC